MAEECPACGEPAEYHEVVSAAGDGAGAATTIDVDELCETDPDTRWNRVCPVASTVEDGGAVRLDLYRHHWGSTE